MAIRLGDAIVFIKGDLSAMRKTFQDGERETKSWALSLGQTVNKTLGRAVVIGAGAALGAITAVGVAGFKLAHDASAYVAVENAFNDMSAGYVSGSDQILQSIAGVTGGMVDHQGIMADMGLMYAQTGKSLEDWEGSYVNMWERSAQIARAKGLDVEDVQHKVSQAIATGNMQLLRNIGIMPDVSAAYDEYAVSVGKSATELTEAERAQARYNAVMSATDDSFGQITVGAATFADHLKTMGVAANNLWLDIGKRLEPLLGSLAANIFPLLEKAIASVGPAIDTLVAGIGPVIEEVANFIARLGDGVDPLTAFQVLLMNLLPPNLFVQAMEIIAAFQEFTSAVQVIGQAIGEFVAEHSTALIGAVAGIGVALAGAGIYAALAAVGAALAAISLPVVALIAVAAALGAAWSTNFLGIQDVTAAVWAFIQEAFETGTSFVQGLWAQHGDQLISVWERFVGVFQSIFAAFQSAFEGDWRGFGENLRAAWDQAWENLRDLTRAGIDALKAFFENTDWAAMAANVVSGLIRGFESMMGALKEAATNIGKAVGDAVSGFLGIQSDSRLMIGYGRNVVGGLATGMLEDRRLPAQAMAQVAAGIPAAAPVTMYNTNSVSLGPVSLRNDQDIYQVAAQVSEIIGNDLRERLRVTR